MQPRWYSAADVQRLLPYERLMEAIQLGLKEVAAGDIVEQHDGGIRDRQKGVGYVAYPAVWPAAGLATLKVLSSIQDNWTRGLPRIHALIVAIDATTGEILATLDGSTVTAMRTAATTALAARQLAEGVQVREIAVIGTGAQAVTHVEALATVFPEARFRLASASGNSDRAAAMAADLAGRLDRSVTAMPMAEALSDIDALACVSSAVKPLFAADAIPPDCLVLSVSAFTPVRQEIDGDVLAQSELIVTDDVERMNGYWAAQPDAAPWRQLQSLEALVAGALAMPTKGRRVFLSGGRAFEDLVATAIVLERLPDR